MNKSKAFVFISVFVLLVSILCGCGNSAPSVDTTVTTTADEISTEEPQSDLELVIITIPQDESNSEIFLDDSSEFSDDDAENINVAETNPAETNTEETVATEPNPTEEQEIELPFIPAD